MIKNKRYFKMAIYIVIIIISVGITISVANAENQEEKDAVYIMLDAGHYGKYNYGCVEGYYESVQMWILTEKLKAKLEEYPGFVVGKTREIEKNDLSLYERGRKSRGYDFFMSLHSNSSSDSSTDYPVAIVSSKQEYTDYIGPLGIRLAEKIKEVLDTNQSARLWTKTQSDGRDWYGVLRSASDVGTPGIILEHSFHTNYNAANFLMNSDNLDLLAEEEASVIASYYGLTKEGEFEAPSIPENFDAVGYNYNKNKITWDQSKFATGYEIYRSNSKDGEYTLINTIRDRATNSYIDDNLEFNGPYYYYIRAYRNINGEIKYSEKTNSNGARPRLLTVKNVNAQGYSYNEINVSWDRAEYADGYNVYRALSENGDYKLVSSVKSLENNQYVDMKVDTDKEYYYKVTSYKTDILGVTKESSLSKFDFASVKFDAVENFDAYAVDKSRTRINWTPNNEVDGYEIYRATDRDGSYSLIKDITDNESQSYVDKYLENYNSYFYKMRAYKFSSGGNKSYSYYTSSNGVKLKDVQVHNFDAYGYDQFETKMTWSKVTNSIGYEIYRANSKYGHYSKIKTVMGMDTTAFVDGTVIINSPYYYKVRALVVDYDGIAKARAFSSSNGARPLPRVPEIRLSTSYTKVRVIWNEDNTVDGHTIYKKQRDGSFKAVIDVAGTSETSYLFTGKKPDTKYTYRVKSYKMYNGEKIYSNFSSICYKKTKAY